MRRKNTYVIDQRPPRKHWRYFMLILFLILGSIVANTVRTQPVSTQGSSQPSVTNEQNDVEESRYDFSNIRFPSEGVAAIGTLDEGLIKTNAIDDSPRPMASIAKIVTALAILEKAPISPGTQGDIITLTSKDEQYYYDYLAIEGTITAVTAGQQMTQYEGLQTMLLPSSNNMTDTMVDRYFGSQEAFLTFANEMLTKLKLHKTFLADASGFSPRTVSTPTDLIRLGQLALQQPIIAEIVSQPEANVAVAGIIPNYNILIERPEVTGIKPGFTDEAHLCLLFSAKALNQSGKDEVIIGVVMGIEDRSVYQIGVNEMLDDALQAIAAQ